MADIINQGGQPPFYGAFDAFKEYLESIFHNDTARKTRLKNNVRLAHLFSGSLDHLEFVSHCAKDLRRILSNAIDPKTGSYFISLSLDQVHVSETAETIGELYTNAIAERCADVPVDYIRQEVTSWLKVALFKKDASKGKKEEDARVIPVRWSEEDENGYLRDAVPFTQDGKAYLKKNLTLLSDYLINIFHPLRIVGISRRLYATWHINGYTADPELLRKDIQDLLKSFYIYEDATQVDKICASVAGTQADDITNFEHFSYLPYKSAVLHLFYKQPLAEFKNGIAYEILPYSRRLKVTNPITGDFFADVVPYDERASHYLDDWSNNSPSMRAVLEEVIGWAVFGSKLFKGCICLYGASGCGKTKFINGLRELVGEDNTASVNLTELKKDHNMEELLYTRANIKDELADGALTADDMATIKTITSENRETVRPLYEKQFKAEIRALNIFATNYLPQISDPIARARFVIIPFNNHLAKPKEGADNKDAYDPIDAYMAQQHVKNYLLYLGILGFRRLLARKAQVKAGTFFECFTPCEEMQKASKDFNSESSNVRDWFHVFNIKAGRDPESVGGYSDLCWFRVIGSDIASKKDQFYKLTQKTCTTFYNEYKTCCVENKQQALKLKEFCAEVVTMAHCDGVISFDIQEKAQYVTSDNVQRGNFDTKSTTRFFILKDNADFSPNMEVARKQRMKAKS